MPEDITSFRNRVDTNIGEIKTHLSYFKTIGWGAIGVFTVVFGGFLTWYLPKELAVYSTKLEMKDQSAKIDSLAAKVDVLSDKISRFTALRISGLIPDEKAAKELSATELLQNFRQTNLIVNAAMKSELPAETELLTTSRSHLRSIVRNIPLSVSLRREAISTFAHVDAYRAFSSNYLSKKPLVEAAPPRPEPDVKAFFVISVPTTLAKFSVINPVPNGAEFVHVPDDFHGDIVVYDLRVVGLKQNLSKIKWFDVIFENSDIEYDGGPLNLQNVTFRNCRFRFGSDKQSKEVLANIEASDSTPVIAVSEFL